MPTEHRLEAYATLFSGLSGDHPRLEKGTRQLFLKKILGDVLCTPGRSSCLRTGRTSETIYQNEKI
jgi:hypothetical protein